MGERKGGVRSVGAVLEHLRGWSEDCVNLHDVVMVIILLRGGALNKRRVVFLILNRTCLGSLELKVFGHYLC